MIPLMLGHGVLQGIALLGHAYADAIGLQHIHVRLRTVLHATIAVMDQALWNGDRLCDGHAQGFQCAGCFKVRGQVVAHDAVRPSVGDQVM